MEEAFRTSGDGKEYAPKVGEMHCVMLKNVLEELTASPSRYFERDEISTFKQLSVYHGLYWDTYKYSLRFSDGRDKNIYIKIRKEGKNDFESKKRLELQQHIKNSYENLQRVYEAFKQFPGYSSIKPIACFPEWLTLVTEESPGTDVWTIIREKAKFYPSEPDLRLLERYCHTCGKWLALFQQITREPDRDPFEFDSVIELFDSYLSRLVYYRNVTFPDEFRKRIIDFCWQLVLSIPNDDRIVVGIHGDFGPGNILVQNDEITVLDIETPKYGLIYWDSTYFHNFLNRLLEIPIYRPATIAKLQKAFIRGFGTSLEPSKKAVTLCMIHNVIQSLLYLAYHRENVTWYRKLFDKILYKKHIQWLRKTCRL
jgi:hypothetical protein